MRIFAAAACASVLALAPSPVFAQFTAAVVPPNAMLIDSTPPAAVAVANGALAMPGKASHVDSSLGSLDASFPSDPEPSVMATGAPAPDTATPLPALALLGAGTLLIGVALSRR